MAGADLRSGDAPRGWSQWHPDLDLAEYGGGQYRSDADLAGRHGGAWEPRGPRLAWWHWPRPLGGTGALLVVTLVLIAAVAVVAAGAGHSRPTAKPVQRPAPTAAPSTPGWYVYGAVGDNPVAPDPGGSGALATSPADPGPSDPGPSTTPTDGGSDPPSGSQPPVPTATGPGDLPGGSGTQLLAGVGCPSGANASVFAHYLAGSPAQTHLGGFAGSGCTGLFWSVPMSGSASTDDPDTYVLWYFNTTPMSTGHCEIWVFVPQGDSPQQAAGNPTVYQVLHSRSDTHPIGTFSVNQTTNQSQWVDAGSFAVTDGQLAVKLVNRGAGTDGASHGAAQLMLRCG